MFGTIGSYFGIDFDIDLNTQDGRFAPILDEASHFFT